MLESRLIIVVQRWRSNANRSILLNPNIRKKPISADVMYDQANIGLESLNEIIKITLAF